jgi:transposase
MSRFRPIDRETDYLLPPSVQDWLPESHLARYVVDVVEGLDLSELERVYGDRGSDAYHPAMLLSLLIYGYATGTHSSRKIERATTRWLSASSLATSTRTTTRWRLFGAASASSSPPFSCRCCKWRVRTSSRALAR